jgi:D-alanyl-D-alanine dipeptidase
VNLMSTLHRSPRYPVTPSPCHPVALWLASVMLLLPAGAAEPLVELRRVAPDIRVDLHYARADNTFGERLYPGNTALLRRPVAERLGRVQARLRRQGLGLKVWDAYRPRSVQYRMWRLRPEGRSRYIANPRKGSKHNRGAAVDVTLVDREGRELPMPTPFDEFSPRAHRGAVRGVPPQARKNARALETAMRAEGFLPNRYEWWHFTAPDWARYPLSDTPIPANGGPDGPAKAGAGR